VNSIRDAEVEELFAEALDVPEGERQAWLVSACRGDELLFAEVRSLLEAFAISPKYIDRSILDGRLTDGIDLELEPLVGRTLGSWRVLSLIATGGMGAVYLGERTDDTFHMKVAIKVLAAGALHPGLMSQFRIERQVLADLNHPGIARLLDGGTTADGVPYLVMEYVEGDSISKYVRTKSPSLEARIRLFLEIADAVHYAHTHLVIHRDLKPGNILVDASGRPRLLDFGIAKVFEPHGEGGGDETAPATAWALTPRYASPEQVLGRRVTTATDIYSLGVILYEVLTGRLPYTVAQDSIIGWSHAVSNVDPQPPSRIRDLPEARRFSGDLDTILLKALAKEPTRRYASVADLAQDLRRYLDGEPVLARGDSARYRLGRFARRNRSLVIGLGALMTILLVALVVTFTFYRRAVDSAARARWATYTSTLTAAESAIMNHNMQEAGELLQTIDDEPGGWEYRHLKARLDRSLRRVEAHDAGITQLRYSTDGSRILTTGVDRMARVWSGDGRDSLDSWNLGIEIESGDFLEGGRVALGLADGRIMIATPGVARPESVGAGSAYALIDVDPAGRLIAAGFENGEAVLFDGASGRELARWKAHHRLTVPRFSPDGTRLATGGADSLVRVWDVSSRRLLNTHRGHRNRVFALEFSPDGRMLVSGSRDRRATAWDLETGAAVSTFSEHRGTVSVLAFQADGRNVISAGSEGRVIVWNPATGGRVAEFHGHQSDVSAIDVSPDGRTVATGEWDGTIRFWKPETDDVRVLTPWHSDVAPIVGLEVEPSSGLVAGQLLSGYKIYSKVLFGDPGRGDLQQINHQFLSALAVLDSNSVIAGSEYGGLQPMTLNPLSRGDSVRVGDHSVTALAFRHSSPLVAVGTGDGSVELWNVEPLEPIRRWRGHDGRVCDLAFSPSGTRLVSAGEDGALRLWDAASGDSVGRLTVDRSPVETVAFHPGGRLLAFARRSGTAGLWDLESDTVSHTLLEAGNGAFAVAFSPDGRRIAVGSLDTLIYLFDTERRSPILRLHGHIGRVYGLTFTRDGNALLSSASDGTLRIWDAPAD
jgi:WD40 repeat protein/serine/threonine protein kinase